MASERILELLRRPSDPDEHEAIRELWKTHSIAEDNRDLPGLLSTLTTDCVYTVAGTGARWEGHEGAARFYTELLTAFPDIHFDLDYIVIGPQGVCEEAIVTRHAPGTLARPRAHGREADLAERDLLPVGSGREAVQGRDGLHRPDVADLSSRRRPAGARRPARTTTPRGTPGALMSRYRPEPCRMGAGSVPKA